MSIAPPQIRPDTGHLRGPDDPGIEIVRRPDGTVQALLEGKPLRNGAHVELRLRGRRGWIPARVEGLPEDVVVVFQADDGTTIRTTYPPGVGARWAGEATG
ncbi:MAG: hypothetical protein D6705_12775 [Deltaproteobacteria bacterium]|nr:MAG: hypothetical protein D6705_12775 [Deltaproteobacteria bacterium]